MFNQRRSVVEADSAASWMDGRSGLSTHVFTGTARCPRQGLPHAVYEKAWEAGGGRWDSHREVPQNPPVTEPGLVGHQGHGHLSLELLGQPETTPQTP